MVFRFDFVFVAIFAVLGSCLGSWFRVCVAAGVWLFAFVVRLFVVVLLFSRVLRVIWFGFCLLFWVCGGCDLWLLLVFC